MALATSLTSARVGVGCSTIDSSICVAVMVNFPLRRARRMMDFWMRGTFSSSISTPRSPRATMTPSAASRMESMFSHAWGFSILATTATGLAPIRSRSARTSSAVRTKESAIIATSCSSAKARSPRSFSVSEGRLRGTPGRLMPLRSPTRPPVRTCVRTLVASLAMASSTTAPSAISTRSPGRTSRAKPSYVVDARAQLPVTCSVVMVNSSPARRTQPPPVNSPSRILGPCRSKRIAARAQRRTAAIRVPCSSSVP
ncbi:MAG: hypothetical protein BWY25_01835 [Chloroflexi bacterium ADurb.Bin222]|nr:MAG: hypothetical protein BWY25_01835 [Chloroflexi bacterium ADurb.Bin222]